VPKVSEAHRDARREQIVSAARQCFRRRGFHATSMQDVLGEAGLSAGAFYLYFKSKDDLVVAIAEDNLRDVLAIVHAAAQRPNAASLGDVLAEAVAAISMRDGREGLADLAVHVWAEALTNGVVAERLNALLDQLRRALADLVADDPRANGATGDGAAVVTVVTAVLPGLILQRALGGPDTLVGVDQALRTLFPQDVPTDA
jgi:TetR/AcrR family transcriptional regulator, transcriptional repressor of aconitase